MLRSSFAFHIGSLLCQVTHFNAVQERPECKNTPLLNHRHPFWELHCVFGGHLLLAAGPHTYRAEAGQLLLIPPATYHHMASTSSDFDSMTIPFSLTRPQNVPLTANDRQMLDLFQPNRPILLFNAAPPLVQALERMRLAALDESDPFMHTERLRHLCPLMLLELFDHLNRNRQSFSSPVTSVEIPYVCVIDDFFALNYDRRVTRQMLADKLHISVRHLNRILKQNYGMSFNEKMQEIRLKNAVELLQATAVPLGVIAEQLGFSSQSAFSAFIRAATGQTPSQIRTKSK